MFKIYLALAAITISLMFCSCEKTVEFTENTEEVEIVDYNLETGFTKISSRGNTSIHEGYGGITLDNIVTTTGTTTSSSSFGANIIVGDDFTFDISEDEFTFGDSGIIEYYILMSDNSEPLDPNGSIQLGVPYPADIIRLDSNSEEEFFDALDNETWLGHGIETINMTILEVTNDYFRGEFEGTYQLNSTNEVVEISGEFNTQRVE